MSNTPSRQENHHPSSKESKICCKNKCILIPPARGFGPGVRPGGPARGSGSGVRPGGLARGSGPGVRPGGPALGYGLGVWPWGPARGFSPGVQPRVPALGSSLVVQPWGPAQGFLASSPSLKPLPQAIASSLRLDPQAGSLVKA